MSEPADGPAGAPDDAVRMLSDDELAAELHRRGISPAPSDPAQATAQATATPSAPAAARRSSSNNSTLGIVMLIVLVVVIGLAFWLSNSGGGDANAGASDEVTQACENSVKIQLKAPATAQFSGESAYATDDAKTSWKVSGNVDAQNGFGALLRMSWTGEATYSGAGSATCIATVTQNN